MATLGTGYLQVVPKFDGLSSSVKRALAGVDVTQEGAKLGKGYADGVTRGTRGLAKSGAVMGAFASITNAAMNVVSSSVGAAASRLDTLNNYPRVMQNLGYSSEDASSSIQRMSDHLQGLPTSLDAMVSTVQGIVAVTGDLGQATDAGLALNDMLLASGANTQVASAAMEQFRQMLSKGKPDMQDWKSLTSAMPGQMNQLAKSMLGPTATANDLYTALGGGGAEATISMGQLLDAMIALDTEGADGMTSFESQARDATSGVQASFENMKTAITRGVADMLDAIGTDNISRVLGDVGKLAQSTLQGFGSVIHAVMPAVEGVVGIFERLESSTHLVSGGITAVVTAFLGFKAVKGVESTVDGVRGSFEAAKQTLSVVSSAVGKVRDAFSDAATAAKNFGRPLEQVEASGRIFANSAADIDRAAAGAATSVAGLGAAAAVGAGAAIAAGVAIADGIQRAITAQEATSGLTRATSQLASGAMQAASAASYESGQIGAVGEAAAAARPDIDSLNEAQANVSSHVLQTARDYESSKATLDDYMGTIDQLAGQVGLSSENQTRLQMAVQGVNDITGSNISVVDAQNGVLSENTDQIHANADAWDMKARAEAGASMMSDLMKQEYQDTQALSQATAHLNDVTSDEYKNKMIAAGEEEAWKVEVSDARKAVDDATGALGSNKAAQQEVTDWTNQSTAAMDANAQALYASVTANNELSSAMARHGVDLSDLSSSLSAAGVSYQTLADIGSANMERLANACNNDTGRMAAALHGINALGLDPKHLNVNDDGTIYDEQGKLWNLDAQTIDGKHYTVEDDGTISIEELGLSHLDARQVADKGFDVRSHDHYSGDLSAVDRWQPRDKHFNIFANLAGNAANMVAGLFHASGGFMVAEHAAGGYIVNRPTVVGYTGRTWHIAGEAGAEWVEPHSGGIIPLSNHRYVRPFAKAVASEMPGGDTHAVIDRLDRLEQAIRGMGVYVGEKQVGELADSYVEGLVRVGGMNYGRR
ncbi:MAG: tape measure protein [Coriobacteriales bacterium]